MIIFYNFLSNCKKNNFINQSKYNKKCIFSMEKILSKYCKIFQLTKFNLQIVKNKSSVLHLPNSNKKTLIKYNKNYLFII